MITEWFFKQSDKYSNKIFCSDGSIYNATTGRKFSLKASFHGYLRLRLYNKGKEYYKWVHRLIYEIFIGDPTGLEIHHKNKINYDNYYLNLEGKIPEDHRNYHKWDRRKQKD